MAKLSKMSPDVQVEMFQRYRDGHSATHIQEWLKKEHNITIHISSINYNLRKIKKIENAERLAAIKEAAQANAVNTVEMIDSNIKQLEALSNKLIAEGDVQKGLKTKDVLIKYMAAKFNLTGVQNKETDSGDIDSEQLLEGLISKIGNFN